MKTIITVQHTESLHHINGMVGSWTDWELSERGLQQARRIGENLKGELAGVPFTLYSSDLKRAMQTAGLVGEALGLLPIPRTELRERNLGRCCGKSVQWLRENLEKPEKTVDDKLFSDAESRRDAWNRLKPFFDEVMGNDESNIILVSHGDLLSLFNAMFLGLEVEDLNRAELFGLAGGVSFLFENGEGKRFIRKISDMSYVK